MADVPGGSEESKPDRATAGADLLSPEPATRTKRPFQDLLAASEPLQELGRQVKAKLPVLAEAAGADLEVAFAHMAEFISKCKPGSLEGPHAGSVVDPNIELAIAKGHLHNAQAGGDAAAIRGAEERVGEAEEQVRDAQDELEALEEQAHAEKAEAAARAKPISQAVTTCLDMVRSGASFKEDTENLQLEALRDLVASDHPFALEAMQELIHARNFAVEPSTGLSSEDLANTDVNMAEGDEGTPPLAAVFARDAQQGQLAAALMLMEAGADPDFEYRDAAGQISTPRLEANARAGGLMALLISAQEHGLLEELSTSPGFLPVYDFGARGSGTGPQ